jgi:hypothetical protein
MSGPSVFRLTALDYLPPVAEDASLPRRDRVGSPSTTIRARRERPRRGRFWRRGCSAHRRDAAPMQRPRLNRFQELGFSGNVTHT